MNMQEQITTLETRVECLQLERDALKFGLQMAEIVIAMQKDKMAEYKQTINAQAGELYHLMHVKSR